MTTSELFKKHFGEDTGGAVGIFHPNFESFFSELAKICEQEDFNKPETHEQKMEREDRAAEITEGAREDFILNWREGK